MKVLEITPQGCGKLFTEYGAATYDESLLKTHPEQIALVIFTGGHDVWPELYGENTLRCTSYNVERDIYEGRQFELALANHIPMVGICRGSQFLCVKSGGKLVQDITGHAGSNHRVRTSCGQTFVCNSSHHQMQLPSEDAVPLAWSEKRLSRYYMNGDGDKIEVDREYECVYYPNINAIGIQFHPEWLNPQDQAVLYAKELVRSHLFRWKIEEREMA